MSSTQEEAVELEKSLTRMERRNRGWWLVRWLGLAAGLVQIAVGVTCLKVGLDAAAALPVENPTATVSALDLYSANLSVMNFCIGYVIGLFSMTVGIGVAIYCLAHWRREKRDRLLVKFARSCLAAQAPIP